MTSVLVVIQLLSLLAMSATKIMLLFTETVCDESLWHAGSKNHNTLDLSRAPAVLVYTAVTELAHAHQVESMVSHVQPKHSKHPTLDALNCGIVRVVSGKLMSPFQSTHFNSEVCQRFHFASGKARLYANDFLCLSGCQSLLQKIIRRRWQALVQQVCQSVVSTCM